MSLHWQANCLPLSHQGSPSNFSNKRLARIPDGTLRMLPPAQQPSNSEKPSPPWGCPGEHPPSVKFPLEVEDSRTIVWPAHPHFQALTCLKLREKKPARRCVFLPHLFRLTQPAPPPALTPASRAPPDLGQAAQPTPKILHMIPFCFMHPKWSVLCWQGLQQIIAGENRRLGFGNQMKFLLLLAMGPG